MTSRIGDDLDWEFAFFRALGVRPAETEGWYGQQAQKEDGRLAESKLHTVVMLRERARPTQDPCDFLASSRRMCQISWVQAGNYLAPA
jgi:hypothetical protein